MRRRGVSNLLTRPEGLAQLLISVLSCWILWIPMLIWAIVEVCTINVDADGNPMV